MLARDYFFYPNYMTNNLLFQGVFTYLVENLGVKNVQFEEMIALDSDYLARQTCVTFLRLQCVSG